MMSKSGSTSIQKSRHMYNWLNKLSELQTYTKVKVWIMHANSKEGTAQSLC